MKPSTDRLPLLPRLFLAFSLLVTFAFAAISLLLRPLWFDIRNFLGTEFPVMLAAVLLGAAAFLALLYLGETKRFGRLWHFILFGLLDLLMIGLLAYLLDQLGEERSVLARQARTSLPYALGAAVLLLYLWFVPRWKALQRRGALALLLAVLVGGALLWSSLPWQVRFTSDPAVFIRSDGVVAAWGTNLSAAGEALFRLDGGEQQVRSAQAHGLKDLGNGAGRVFLPLAELPVSLEVQVSLQGVRAVHPTSVEQAGTMSSEPLVVPFPAPGDALTLVSFSDIHERVATYDLLAAQLPWEEIDLVVYNGDMVNSVADAAQVADTLLGLQTGGLDLPRLVVRGNHETRNRAARLLDDWLLPEDGQWYQAFTLGNTFIIVIDSGEDKTDSHIEYGGLVDFAAYHRQQAAWLEGVLASDAFQQAQYRLVVMHIPLFGDTPTLAEFEPVAALLRANEEIDLMLNGHTHTRGIFLPQESGLPYPVAFGGGSQVEDAGAVIVRLGAEAIGVQIIAADGQVVAELP